jgi:photosystem II stability/assembly factor-like uncharacterized protein
MDEHRDEVDDWLDVRVRPLLPPPGTFEAVHARARRRRTRRAMLSAAGAVAVAAVAVLVIPQVVTALHAGGQPVASGTVAPSSRLRPAPGRHARSSSPAPTAAVPGLAPPPLSVTFVGNATGWALGQATSPAQCDLPAAPACLLLERTDSGGATWRTAPPPPTHGPNGSTGVSQVRFLDTRNGWAFGPQLWATHDAGRTWRRIPTGGLRVTTLETRGQRAFAVWAHCTGTGPAFAVGCSSFAVHSSPASSDQWAQVPGTSTAFAGPAAAAALVLTGTTAYLFAPDGVLISGPLTGAAWQPVDGAAAQVPPLPCLPGAAQPGGQPARALLAPDASYDLALLCAGRPAASGQRKAIYFSQDGGLSWHRAGTAPWAGTAMSLSGSPSGSLVLATSRGIETSSDGGATWSAATVTAPPGGFAYVGMTTSMQGVAVPVDPAQHAIWFTYDGAVSWRPSPLS